MQVATNRLLDPLRDRLIADDGRTLDIAVTLCGCAIERTSISPSRNWLVTSRSSGQGEWGYDVIDLRAFKRVAGVDQDRGYMLDLPTFGPADSYILGGHGERWLGGWWSHPDDEPDQPSRGGDFHFGWLFRHGLPEHNVTRHELRVLIPAGWLPSDPWAESWMSPVNIQAYESGVSMLLPGGVDFSHPEELSDISYVPLADPDGGKS